MKLLAELRQRSGKSPWVFPATRGEGHFIGLQKVWARIRAHAGLQDVRLHDLRHNLASVAVASGESLFITGKVLGHRKARSTERYAHLADDPIQAAADRAASRIAAQLAANSEMPAPRRHQRSIGDAEHGRRTPRTPDDVEPRTDDARSDMVEASSDAGGR
jgi:hypothetical protein